MTPEVCRKNPNANGFHLAACGELTQTLGDALLEPRVPEQNRIPDQSCDGATSMNPVQIIAKKRDGRALSRAEISHFIQGFWAGRIPNYQMSALAMAICLRGMTCDETAALTEEMLASGRQLSWSSAETANELVAVAQEIDSVPRLERAAKAGGAPGIDRDFEPDLDETGDSELEESELDARDTVDLGEDSIDFHTVLLDGTSPATSKTSAGRDTVNLESLAAMGRRSQARGMIVDKYSTGGLGDKTSMILAPLLACCGMRVPMISGRGLDAVGSTLDKLESIPGFRTDLSLDEIRDLTERIGCVITGVTSDLAPADHKLYSLRDVTATVASVPLITASVLSKKMAMGVKALVLDVKWGSGGYSKTLSGARKLAESLVETGRQSGLKTVSLVTCMDEPLGRMIGSSLEIDEVLNLLAGRGPADVWEVISELGAELLLMADGASTLEAAREILKERVTTGRASAKFREMVIAQGGDLDRPRARTDFQFDVRAIRSGYVGRINMDSLELAMVEMGAGRRVLSDSIDHAVGLELLVRIGDQVQTGQPLIRVHCRKQSADSVKLLLRTAITVRQQQPERPALISERIGA